MCPQSDPAHPFIATEPPEYSPEERRILLDIAHKSIEAAVEDCEIELIAPSQHLSEPRGAFTTLHLLGKLRGCIGYVLATQALYTTVAETARAAAMDDPRFQPVTSVEAEHLRIEISVLSVLRPITPEAVVIGKHGLVVMQGGRRGLLLPQVPVEWGWDRETFLKQTCLKAGLSPNAWQQGAELQVFTAEVFGEDP